MNKNVDGTRFPFFRSVWNSCGSSSKFSPSSALPLGKQVNSVVCLPRWRRRPLGIGTVSSRCLLHRWSFSIIGIEFYTGKLPGHGEDSLWSARLDHHWNNRNNSFLRVGVSPSLVTGPPSTIAESGLRSEFRSRAGLSQTRDLNFTFQHDTIVSGTALMSFVCKSPPRNPLWFSQLRWRPDRCQHSWDRLFRPGALFSCRPHQRRFEFTDNVSLVRGKHTFKMGVI